MTMCVLLMMYLKDEELADFHALCESNSGAVASLSSSAQHATSLLQSRTLQCTASRHFPATGSY